MGYDPREAIGLHVFVQSLIEHSSLPVELTVLTPKLSAELGIKSDGTNAFSKIRFAVPYLCNFKGFAIFADGADMMLRKDLAELWLSRQAWYAASVVKHKYKPKPVKYVGTEMESPNEAYPRKNWSSLVLWSCSHYANRVLTPQFISQSPGADLQRFKWIPDDRIGALDASWNHIPQELTPNQDAKLVHFSLGIPGFAHYHHDEHAGEWHHHLKAISRGLQASERA